MDSNNSNNGRKGFTVSELEGTAKKYASEIGLSAIFVVTAIFTLIWGGAMMVWSVLLCMILGIVGTLVPDSMTIWMSKAFDFIYKEKVMLIVVGIVMLVIGIFIPVLIFALIGLIAGGTLSLSMKRKSKDTFDSSSNNDSGSNSGNDTGNNSGGGSDIS
ncbi:MAG: hypothetical protein S4CHLAM20_06010 [Chlamydiia bacterium]|nr:hypothetical protein [Chlamydiia bacterium]